MSNEEKEVTSSDGKCIKECENSKTSPDSSCNAGNGVVIEPRPQSSEETPTPDTQEDKPATQSEGLPTGEAVNFKLVYNKTKYDIEFPVDGTVKQLKEHLTSIINVLPAMQKVMIKGLAKDEKTLRELGVTRGSKVMVVGSKLDDVVSVNTPKSESSSSEKPTTITSSKEPLCRQKLHRKIIDKGVPEDAMPGIKNTKDVLPSYPLSGMVNKHGGKVRLTFKLELDQIWIGTKERTEKVNMNHIRHIVSEAIEGFEQYHIMGLQLGPTEASRYWIYWVPAQYVDAIRDTVLGKCKINGILIGIPSSDQLEITTTLENLILLQKSWCFQKFSKWECIYMMKYLAIKVVVSSNAAHNANYVISSVVIYCFPQMNRRN